MINLCTAFGAAARSGKAGPRDLTQFRASITAVCE